MYRLFNPKSAKKNNKNGIRIRINVVKFTLTSFCIQNIIVHFHEWVCRKKTKITTTNNKSNNNKKICVYRQVERSLFK